MRFATIALGLVASLSIAEAGCYWPVPSCEETTKVRVEKVFLAPGEVQIRPDGSFSLGPSRHYASCSEFCGGLSGVENVISCELPRLGTKSGFSEPWTISCKVDEIECREKRVGPRIDFH